MVRFGNYLRNNCLSQANSLDLSVIELATKAIARLTQVSGTYTANLKFDFIDHEVKKAFEWLSAPERNEGDHNLILCVTESLIWQVDAMLQSWFCERSPTACPHSSSRTFSSSLMSSSTPSMIPSLGCGRVAPML